MISSHALIGCDSQGLLSRTKCEIHVFDPTMTEEQKAIVRAVPHVVFHDYGLGTKDAWVDLGTDTSQTKGRLVPKFETKTLDTIMKVGFFPFWYVR
jgi:hypothetical protein